MSRSYSRVAATGFGLAITIFVLAACTQEIALEIGHDREIVAADRAKLATDKAQGNIQAVDADAAALQAAQAQFQYDANGWEPLDERGGHGARSHSGHGH